MLGTSALPVGAQDLDPARPATGADAAGPGRNVVRDVMQAVEDTASDFAYIYTAPLRLNPRSALWVGAFAAGFAALYASDREIYDAIKRNEFEDGYKPVRDTGEFFEPIGYQGFLNQFLIGGLILGYITDIDLLKQIPADILESFIITGVGKELANRLFGRRGPADGVGPRRFGYEGGRSLPSGHSLAISTVATVLAHHVRWLPFQIAAYGMAGTVLLQRMSSDHHWASDVYVGSVFGFVVTRAILDRKAGRALEVRPMVTPGGTMGMGLQIQF